MPPLTRRSALRSLAALSAAPLLAPASDGADAFAGGGFKLGLVTYNVGKDWDVPTLIKNCESTGFEAVELRTTHKHGVEPTMEKGARAEVRKRFADSKVRLLSLGTTCEFHSPKADALRAQVDECKRFIELARDLGCLGIKVRPNGIPPEVPEEKTITQIGGSLRECGEAASAAGVEIWVEVHGKDSAHPPRCAAMMQACGLKNVGLCWNSNPTDLMGGTSVKPAFDLLRPWLLNCHINELASDKYPWRELFTLLRQSGYSRYTLCEVQGSTDPLRFMSYYRALWRELTR